VHSARLDTQQGSGFSTNTGGTGNIIRIGAKYFCDPIPLHCTTVQIACKTRPALNGLFPCVAPWLTPRCVRTDVHAGMRGRVKEGLVIGNLFVSNHKLVYPMRASFHDLHRPCSPEIVCVLFLLCFGWACARCSRRRRCARVERIHA